MDYTQKMRAAEKSVQRGAAAFLPQEELDEAQAARSHSPPQLMPRLCPRPSGPVRHQARFKHSAQQATMAR